MSVLLAPSQANRGWKPLQRGRILVRATFPEFIETDGELFFQTGKLIVNTLSRFSESARSLQLDRLEQFYASDFAGTSLGLTQHELKSQKDGILEYAWEGDPASRNGKEAIAEWRAYM